MFLSQAIYVLRSLHVAAESVLGDAFIGVPDVVSGQINVLPTHGRQMRQKRVLNRVAILAKPFDGAFM
jgi:hypothetical protein